jgi:hypothetical protein
MTKTVKIILGIVANWFLMGRAVYHARTGQLAVLVVARALREHLLVGSPVIANLVPETPDLVAVGGLHAHADEHPGCNCGEHPSGERQLRAIAARNPEHQRSIRRGAHGEVPTGLVAPSIRP